MEEWTSSETPPASFLYPWNRKWLINAKYVDRLLYQIKSTILTVGKNPFKKEVKFVIDFFSGEPELAPGNQVFLL